MVANLDITLASLVRRELSALSERMKEKYWEEKEKYWNMLEKKEEMVKEDDDEEEERKDMEIKEGKTESVTIVTKDEAKEEEGEESQQRKDVHKEEEEEAAQVTVTEKMGKKEEASCSEIQPETNPNASSTTEGKDWQQMLRLVMFLQDEGNFLIKENRYKEASVKFKEAIEYVDFLQNKVSEAKRTQEIK